MFILWRRYSRSGFAPWWLYGLLAVGFAGLAVWAFVVGEWLVGGIALAAIPVAALAIALARRVNEATMASRREEGKDRRYE